MKEEWSTRYMIKSAQCGFTRGYRRGLIYDLQRGISYPVPNSLLHFAEQHDGARLGRVMASFGKRNQEIIGEYLDFLTGTEAVYLAQSGYEARLFKPAGEPFRHEKGISNSIVYTDSMSSAGFVKSARALEELNCRYIQVYCAESFSETVFNCYMEIFEESGFRDVELVFAFGANTMNHDFTRLLMRYRRCGKLRFYNAPEDRSIPVIEGLSSVELMNREYDSRGCRGRITREYFSIHPYLYSESQHHNTCLNRKLCIDQDGYIKNCPHMAQHYGHISHTDIAEVVTLPEFQQWWHIRKDEIDVCRDCEFRHMCTDCRALIKDPGNLYSQPAKCTYNPYICKWAGEEGYVPVEECGTYSRETGFVPDKGKIKRLNKEIWRDG